MLVGRPGMLAQVTAIKKGKVVLVLPNERTGNERRDRDSGTIFTDPAQTSVVRTVSARRGFVQSSVPGST